MSNEAINEGACRFKKGVVKEYKIKFGNIDEKVKDYVNHYATEILQDLFETDNKKLQDFLTPHELKYKYSEDKNDTHVLVYYRHANNKNSCVAPKDVKEDPITFNARKGVTCWPNEFYVCKGEGGDVGGKEEGGPMQAT